MSEDHKSLLSYLELEKIEEAIANHTLDNIVSFMPINSSPINNNFLLSTDTEHYMHQVIIFYNEYIVRHLMDRILGDINIEHPKEMLDKVKKISVEKKEELEELIQEKENNIFMAPIKRSVKTDKIEANNQIICKDLAIKLETISHNLHYSIGSGLEYLESSLSKNYENISNEEIEEYLDDFMDNLDSMVNSLLILDGFHLDFNHYKSNKENINQEEYLSLKKDILELNQEIFKNMLLGKAYRVINYNKYKHLEYVKSFLPIMEHYLEEIDDNNLAIIELRTHSDKLSKIYEKIKNLDPIVSEFISKEIEDNYDNKEFYLENIELWNHAKNNNWLKSLKYTYQDINFKKAKPLLMKQKNASFSELLSDHVKFNGLSEYPDIDYEFLQKISNIDDQLFNLCYKRLDIFYTVKKLSEKYDIKIIPRLIPTLKIKSEMLLNEGEDFINLLLKSDYYQNELVNDSKIPTNYKLLNKLHNTNEELFNKSINFIDNSQLESLISLAESDQDIKINQYNQHWLIPHEEYEKKDIIYAINNYKELEKAIKYKLIKSKTKKEIIKEFSDPKINDKINNIESAEKYMHNYNNNFLRNKIIKLIDIHGKNFCDKYLHYFKKQGIYQYIRVIDLLKSVESRTAKDICRKNRVKNILIYHVGKTDDNEWKEIKNIIQGNNPCEILQKKYPGDYTKALKNQNKYDEKIGKKYLELQKIGKEKILDQLGALRTKKQISQKLFDQSIEMLDNQRYECVKIGIKQITMGASENNILEFYDHTYMAESEKEFLECFNPAEDYLWWKKDVKKQTVKKSETINLRDQLKQTEQYKKRSQEIKDAFKSGYHTNFSRKQMEILNKYGLEVEYQSNHLKIHKPNYFEKYVTCAVTPSDTRVGIKVAGDIIDLLLDLYVHRIEKRNKN